ncbi:MAG: alpha/beta hydrolase [Candidatus Thorarchaeota archaeon]|nr:alpha/beta hydrolase [Candidatus Thorarchaeota archaeon]
MTEASKDASTHTCSMKPYFEEKGEENPGPLILVHGAGGSTATWFMQLKHLSDSLHVVAIDLNGHGKTEDADANNVFESYLSDIESIVSQFDMPVLGGHSMGGALTQLFALSKPETLSGIILVGTGAKLRVNPMIFQMLESDFDGYLDAMEEFAFFEETDEELKKASRKEMSKCPARIIARDFKACDSFDIMGRIGNIMLPALIVVGENDLLTPQKYSAYLQDSIPDSELVIIPKAGHSVMLEQWDSFNDSVLRWFKAKIAK